MKAKGKTSHSHEKLTVMKVKPRTVMKAKPQTGAMKVKTNSYESKKIYTIN